MAVPHFVLLFIFLCGALAATPTISTVSTQGNLLTVKFTEGSSATWNWVWVSAGEGKWVEGGCQTSCSTQFSVASNGEGWVWAITWDGSGWTSWSSGSKYLINSSSLPSLSASPSRSPSPSALPSASPSANPNPTKPVFTSEGGVLKMNGQRLKLKGASWFGFETGNAVFHGLWAVDYRFIFSFLRDNKFNAIRIPFHLELVLNPSKMPNSINYGYCSNNVSCNLDLKSLTSLQLLDKMVKVAGEYGLLVMLDLHSFLPDNFAAEGLWYSSQYPEDQVALGWETLAKRYKDQWNVFAADIKNEPHQSTWGTGNTATDFNSAVERIGNRIHAAGANWLIFAEGVGGGPPTCNPACFWGENLLGVKTAPIKLNLANKLVYSPHTYGPSVASQSYFSDPTFPANMPAVWDYHFGFIKSLAGPAVVIGEWGGNYQGSTKTWMDALASYLVSRDLTDQFFWCVNPNSGDTGGLLDNDWITPVKAKLELLVTVIPNPTVIAGRSS